MNIAMNCSTDNMLGRAQYEKTGNNKIDDFYKDLSSASEKSTSHAVGDALALTAIPYNDSLSYGMLAFNSDRSTEEDPIIKISCNYGGQQRYYDVHVNEVDPRNASAVEMFALCSYMDEEGITDGGTFGSYAKLHAMGSNASMINGFIDLDDSSNYNVKVDWIKMLKEMASEYLKTPETYAQSLAANKLADELMDYIK
jgi:hypothetical protein